MAKLKVSSADLVARARAQVEEIETADAIEMVGNPDVVMVDLRDVRERQRTGFISNAVSLRGCRRC